MDSDDGGGLEKRETRNGRGWEEVEAGASKGERWRGREKIAIEIQGGGHAEYCDISFLADIQFSGLKRRRRRAPTALIEMEHDMPIYLLPLSLFTATNATSRVCSPGIYTNKQQRSSSGRVGPRGRHRPGGGVYSRA